MKNITILLLILFSSNFGFSQIKNRVYGEVHLARIGQDVKGGTGFYNDEFSFDTFQGFEFGYAISKRWLTNLKFRRGALFTIDGNSFENFEDRRIEFSLGLEYVRKYHKKYHWSYGVSYFFESVKSSTGNCRSSIPNDWIKHKRSLKGFNLELGFNYRLKPDFWIVIATRYRTGNTWIPKHKEISPFEYFCYDRNTYVDIFDIVSKVGFRFFL